MSGLTSPRTCRRRSCLGPARAGRPIRAGTSPRTLGRHRMRRLVVSATVGLFLLTMLPGVASAARVTRFTNHHAGGECHARGDGGYIDAGFETDSNFGTRITIQAWLDP